MRSVVGDTFTLVVYVERRAPEEYKSALTDEQLKAPAKTRMRPAAKPKEDTAEDAEEGGEEKTKPQAEERPSKGQGREGRGKGKSKRPG